MNQYRAVKVGRTPSGVAIYAIEERVLGVFWFPRASAIGFEEAKQMTDRANERSVRQGWFSLY